MFGLHAGEFCKSHGPKCIKFELLDKKLSSFKTKFDKALTPFCKTFLWLKQLFDGKLLIFRLPFFGVPKFMVIQHVCVTRLKIAPNMADPTSMNHSISSFKA